MAKSAGVDVIVVDHHNMPELLPPAAAILHPKQLPEEHPLYNLPGVGVAYKLAEALLVDHRLHRPQRMVLARARFCAALRVSREHADRGVGGEPDRHQRFVRSEREPHCDCCEHDEYYGECK